MEPNPLVVGAGPTGLSAALFLFERGVRCRIVDNAAVPSATSRAQVVNPRALELLESSGVAAAIVAEGHPIHQVVFYDGWTPMARLELGHVHPRYRMSVLPQARTEALLTEALAIRGIHPERSTELLSVSQDEQRVSVLLAHPDRHESLCASLLYAADGAHSVVRDSLGIQFNGSGFAEPWPLYDLCLDDPLDIGNAHVSFVKEGLVFLLCIHSGLWRIFGNVREPLEHLPSGVSPGKIEWKSSFHIADRVASRETVGRVAIGGDAAHIHAPVDARGVVRGELRPASCRTAPAYGSRPSPPGRGYRPARPEDTNRAGCPYTLQFPPASGFWRKRRVARSWFAVRAGRHFQRSLLGSEPSSAG